MWDFLKNGLVIAKRVKAVVEGGEDEAEMNTQGVSPFLSAGKKEVFPGDDKSPKLSLGCVIVDR